MIEQMHIEINVKRNILQKIEDQMELKKVKICKLYQDMTSGLLIYRMR